MLSPTPTRLYRPKPPDFFEPGVVATYDATHNIVAYNKEFFTLTNSRDFGTLCRMTSACLFATTEQ